MDGCAYPDVKDAPYVVLQAAIGLANILISEGRTDEKIISRREEMIEEWLQRHCPICGDPSWRDIRGSVCEKRECASILNLIEPDRAVMTLVI